MPDAPIPSLAKAREIKITELSTHFANDDLSLDELERRIEQVYKAANVAELEKITADLRAAAMVPVDYVRAKVVPGKGNAPATYEVPNSRLLSLMSSTKRVGRWAVPRELDVLAIMSDTRIDLTHAVMTSGTVDLDIRAVMASMRVIVPPGMRVVVDVNSFMSTVQSRADELPSDDASAAGMPIVRLTGFALMSEVKVVVRRREETSPVDDDDDDDE